MKNNLYELTVGENGEVILPVDLRTRYEIEKGQKLIMVQRNDELVILPKFVDPVSTFAMTADEKSKNEFRETKLAFED